MCGIYLYLSSDPVTGLQTKACSQKANKIKHRGPDATRVLNFSRAVAVFHRLSIVDPTSDSMQPFIRTVSNEEWVCMVNGEIYNYKDLYQKIDPEYKPKSHSDCEVVLSLFLTLRKRGVRLAISELNTMLDGEYAVVLYNSTYNYSIAFTDELRIRPLFLSYDYKIGQQYTEFVIASEQKACGQNAMPILPRNMVICGNIYLIDNPRVNYKQDFNINQFPISVPESKIRFNSFENAADTLRDLLVLNVHNKLHPERNYGFLLSGGIDSSLICGIASRYCKDHGLPRIRTFTVGFSAEASDIIAARLVALHIDSVHSEIIVPYSTGVDLVPGVICAIESWDQTSVRASIPMMIAAQYIKKQHPEIAVIYSGEVADELLRGYLYNKKQVSPEEICADMSKRLYDISMFDGLRADRVIASVGMELRLPFFSKKLLDFAFSLPWEYLDPTANGGVEKALLRKAFTGTGYIPDQILHRTKNAFSDATSIMTAKSGSEWKEMLKLAAESNVTEERFNRHREIYPDCKWIQTREDMWYMDLYTACGYNIKAIPYKWLPSWVDATDSSATTLGVFSATKL